MNQHTINGPRILRALTLTGVATLTATLLVSPLAADDRTRPGRRAVENSRDGSDRGQRARQAEPRSHGPERRRADRHPTDHSRRNARHAYYSDARALHSKDKGHGGHGYRSQEHRRHNRGHRSHGYRYGHDTFVVPRRIGHGHHVTYRPYYHREAYYAPHSHRHTVYYFPIYTNGYWTHEPYYYCGEELYVDSHYDYGGVNFSLNLRF